MTKEPQVLGIFHEQYIYMLQVKCAIRHFMNSLRISVIFSEITNSVRHFIRYFMK